jgi:excisionase family DNA binding protein
MALMGHTGHASESALWIPIDRATVETMGVMMSTRTADAEPLLTPAEVATMFRVDPKTVTRWAKAGKLTSIRTLGGHRRYREAEVRSLLAGVPQNRAT